ncbi:MAG TPA: ABC transporter permease [Planctomycetota bacterium]|nr:ABC transporter permease [Planctomycetota bacterium]
MNTVRRVLRQPLGLVGAALVLGLVLVAIFAPWIAPYDTSPGAQVLADIKLPRSPAHPLGTDHTGIDVLSRLIMGARTSLLIGVGASALTVLIGLSVGALAGYAGGTTDLLIMRVIDVMLAFPSLLFIIILAAAFGQSLTAVFVALALANWAPVAQLVRGQVLVLKTSEFVTASRALGAGHLRLLLRHILPNCLSILLVVFTMKLGTMILAESSLGFLGLGADNLNAWGRMVNFAYDEIGIRWWLSVFPASAIAVTVIAFNLVGDAVRDALDPKLRLR